MFVDGGVGRDARRGNGSAGSISVQTNSLIAAAAGSFAGTVARKLAQESFLSSLSRDLGR
jgi:hypothetical protein